MSLIQNTCWITSKSFCRTSNRCRFGASTECLSAASVEICISDSLQIGQNVMSEERPSQGDSRENEAPPKRRKVKSRFHDAVIRVYKRR